MHNSLFTMEYPSLANEKTTDILRLIRSENVGPVTFFKLLSYFGSVSKALDAIPDMAKRGGRAKPIKIASIAAVKEEIEKTEAFGAKIIVYGSPDYPKMLHTIHDAPPVIFTLGRSNVWQKGINIGIVGARNASANGCRLTQKIASDLGKSDICVISGLARGIDAAAHSGAIDTGTVGVIAGGINTIYPSENTYLYDKMRDVGGIISHQPFGFEPLASSFPARNRIISGMSHGVLVVEASLRSGSLITARQALDQNREIFAIPGSPMDPRCKGTNQLLRDGAALTESAQDIIQQMQHLKNAPLSEPNNTEFQPSAIAIPSESELEKARKLIVGKLSHDPVLVDELITQCQVTAGVVMTVLLEMELAGRINRHPGNRVSLRFES
ncbi:MAG: DNA-processing protein DprA [Alphaproteobacteria bacterium]|nr:DNA-processing protein DprA [Alphaproteobacteria bacterium]